MKHIVLTGGGSAGHVTPHLAIIEQLAGQNIRFSYIGSNHGIEKELIETTGTPYYGVSSGKWRRYYSKQNATDVFRTMKGVLQAYHLLGKLKPDLVFSKGGFVSVPVVVAAKLRGINIYIHESDITPGLANKISIRFADRIFTTFKETLEYLPDNKALLIGSPVRPAILNGTITRADAFLSFDEKKPIILIMGGSLGSHAINKQIHQNIDALTMDFNIVHLCGKGYINRELANKSGYRQYEYITKELPDLLKAASLIISRAGSNIIFECLALKKPMILIPLTKKQSRGDQLLNARAFEKEGFAKVIEEEDLKDHVLFEAVQELYSDRHEYERKMAQAPQQNGLVHLVEQLLQ